MSPAPSPQAPSRIAAPTPPPHGEIVPAPRPAATAGPDAKVVMVVEDDPSIREMLVRSLGVEYTVYEAADGQLALETLGQIEPPDLMIMDVMMPRMDGLQLAAKLRTESQLKGVPIIFLTGRDSPKDVVQGINMGARHYLTKPFKIQDLLAKVAKTFGAKK
jgi:DNA-binding response OmpR family regulator